MKDQEPPCHGPPTTGFCIFFNWIDGFTYDSVKKSCKKFSEMGCSRSNNLFDTKEECEAKCSKHIF